MNLKYFILFLTLSKVSCSTPAAIGTAAMEAIGLISSVITIGLAGRDSMKEPDEPDKSTDTYVEFKKISNKISELESNIYTFNTNYMKILLSHELSNKKEKYNTYISKIRNFYDETNKWSQKLKKNKTLFLDEESERMISPHMENYPRDILFKISELFFKNKNQEKITLLENYENIIKQKNDNSSARNYHWIKNKDNNIYYGNANKACTSMKSIETKTVRFNDFGFIKSKNCISLDAKFVKFNYSSGNISSDVYQWAPPLRQPPQL
ncbi:hypothetical protein HCN44_006520 [Aphidius gifuensis]|uniref:Venom protein n=1 Tax=Aphidius gifuensis TaxID=684658 RepID=A0A834XXN5_APHGI|nr:hypothetical protein HCN44_006520 [Aphidius gifuensis]